MAIEDDDDIPAVIENEILDNLESNFSKLEIDIDQSNESSSNLLTHEKIPPQNLRKIYDLLKEVKELAKCNYPFCARISDVTNYLGSTQPSTIVQKPINQYFHSSHTHFAPK